MQDQPITADEFRKRLTTLCSGGRGSGFPRKRRDRHILFRSIAQSLASHPYTEHDLNVALKSWLANVGSCLELDHVTLRRYLVDAGWLRRDRNGTTYEALVDGNGEAAFDPEIAGVNSSDLVRDARERAVRRKRTTGNRQR